MEQSLSVIQVIMWPIVAVVAIFLLRRELHMLLLRLTTVNVKEGSFQFEKYQAQKNSILDVKDTLAEEFGNRYATLTIDQVNALIDQKLRSLDGIARRAMENRDLRTSQRKKWHEKIKVAREDGVFVEATTQELSEDGIGFRTTTHLNRNEIVTIIPEETPGHLLNMDACPFMIVRVEPMGSEFYYGARIVPKETHASGITTH